MPAFRHRHSLSLEVATEGLHADLEIISPTPRAFAFPINSQDRPYSSTTPLHFGVEPDLHHPSTPSLPRGWSPSPSESSSATFSSHSTFSTSSFSSSPATPASASGRRRKSSAISLSSDSSSPARPKKGDEDYIKRPENAFILFRRKCCEDRTTAVSEDNVGPAKKQRQADLSKTISQQWKELSAEEKQEWENLAKEKKKEHEKMHPGYVYRPQRKGTKKSIRKDGTEDLEGSSSFMVEITAPPRTTRSASAPTPPPFQSVMHMSGNSPTSPGFIPTIARRPSQSDLSPDFAQFEFESHGTTFVQPNCYNSDPSSFIQSSFDERPFFAGRARSQSLHLSMPTYEQQNLLPSAQILSPASDNASPVSPAESSPYTPGESSPYTPLDAITGPFSQFGMSSPFDQNPSWTFPPNTYSEPSYSPCDSPHESQQHPQHVEAMPFQPTTTWEDVSLWEGDERFEMSTALCEIGLPPPLEEEELPMGAEFFNQSGCDDPSYDDDSRFASEYQQPGHGGAYDVEPQHHLSHHNERHHEPHSSAYEFVPYLASH